jgi:hypothetical protein
MHKVPGYTGHNFFNNKKYFKGRLFSRPFFSTARSRQELPGRCDTAVASRPEDL